MRDTITPTEAEAARREARNERSREHRARRRAGDVVVSLVVQRDTIHALERLGLLASGERDPYEVACAAAQFLHAAPGMVMVGEGLFPEPDDAEGDDAG